MKNKKLANRTLVYLAAAFVLIVGIKIILQVENIFIELVVFIIESALVGGIADWFAVTALFAHPLGIKIPHTALVPNNREKVITSIIHLVENELLGKEALIERIERFSLIERLIPFIDNRKIGIKKKVRIVILKGIQYFSTEKGIEKLENTIKKKIFKVPCTPLLIRSTKALIESENINIFYNMVLDELIIEIKKSSVREQIYTYLLKKKEEQAGNNIGLEGFLKRAILAIAEQSNTLNLNDATDVILNEILSTIEEMREPNHPLRKQISIKIYSALAKLDSDEGWKCSVEVWKNRVVSEIDFKEIIRLIATSIGEDSPSIVWIESQLEKQWNAFKDNKNLQKNVEDYIKQLVIQMLKQEHKRIGYVLEEVLREFGNEDLVAFIEDKVGEDLQWIRINGSLIGGIMGALIFTFLHFVYDPILQLFM